jgi:hypothetical protein
MKINISIMTWINRFLVVPLLISLLISSIEHDFLFMTAILAFFIGIFQVFSFLFTLFYVRYVNKKYRTLILIYFGIVALYFMAFFCAFNFYKVYLKESFLTIPLYSIPILLSLFWTYILESLKKER